MGKAYQKAVLFPAVTLLFGASVKHVPPNPLPDPTLGHKQTPNCPSTPTPGFMTQLWENMDFGLPSFILSFTAPRL